MVIEENWGIAPERLRAFFEAQPDVCADGQGFGYRQCRITLTPLDDRMLGPWPMPRTLVRMEGPEEDVDPIHRRFFLQFLSAGG